MPIFDAYSSWLGWCINIEINFFICGFRSGFPQIGCLFLNNLAYEWVLNLNKMAIGGWEDCFFSSSENGQRTCN